jgi:hypothetical protein
MKDVIIFDGLWQVINFHVLYLIVIRARIVKVNVKVISVKAYGKAIGQL